MRDIKFLDSECWPKDRYTVLGCWNSALERSAQNEEKRVVRTIAVSTSECKRTFSTMNDNLTAKVKKKISKKYPQKNNTFCKPIFATENFQIFLSCYFFLNENVNIQVQIIFSHHILQVLTSSLQALTFCTIFTFIKNWLQLEKCFGLKI